MNKNMKYSALFSVTHHTALINQTLVEQLLEYPPFGFHKGWVKSLVIVVEIDPTSHTLNGCSPLRGVTHDNGSALGVVLCDTHVHDILFSLWSMVNHMHSFYSILRISSTLMPSFLSISYSTGKPWVSHPKRRSTLWPVEWAYRVTISYNAIKKWIFQPHI